LKCVVFLNLAKTQRREEDVGESGDEAMNQISKHSDCDIVMAF